MADRRNERTVVVPEGLDGERLDAALARLFGLSRTSAAQLATDGAAQLDGTRVAKSARVRAGAVLDVALPLPPPPVTTDNPRVGREEPVAGLRVVAVDSDLVVIDKPAGVAAHPSPGWTGPSVLGELAAAGYQLASSGPAERQGIVHRLDVGTSGLMVLARSEYAYATLKQAFRQRAVDKAYCALVQGHPDPLTGTIDAPIDRHPRRDYRFAVVAGGKQSVTHYETIEAFRYASLLRVDLETGRTHQIRVHLAAVGHPCCGDLTYGADPRLSGQLGLTRQWLHAVRLGFTHPGTGEYVSFESDYPGDLADALEVLADG